VRSKILQLSIISTVLLAIIGNAYAINYQPDEIITEVDGVTITPYAINMDSEGRLYVSDITARKVYILQRGDEGLWHIKGSLDSAAVVDIEIDSSGHLILSRHSGSEGYPVEVYELQFDSTTGDLISATILQRLTNTKDGVTVYKHISAIGLYENNGNRYYALSNNHVEESFRTIQIYDSNFNMLFQFSNDKVYDANRNETGNVTNGYPISSSIIDLNYAQDGALMVAYQIGVIAIYDINYDTQEVTLRVAVGDAGSLPGYFSEPRGVINIKTDEYNWLVVSDNLNNRLQVFKYNELTNGINEPLFYFGNGIAGNGERQLTTPRKLVFNDNSLYVADFGNSRIIRLAVNVAYQTIMISLI
jgi:hypothetical protein